MGSEQEQVVWCEFFKQNEEGENIPKRMDCVELNLRNTLY